MWADAFIESRSDNTTVARPRVTFCLFFNWLASKQRIVCRLVTCRHDVGSQNTHGCYGNVRVSKVSPIRQDVGSHCRVGTDETVVSHGDIDKDRPKPFVNSILVTKFPTPDTQFDSGE